MYTTHGYHIKGTPLEGRPDFRTRNGAGLDDCGGPGACDVCSVEAANATGKFELHPEYEAFKEELAKSKALVDSLLAQGFVADQVLGQLTERRNALSKLTREPDL